MALTVEQITTIRSGLDPAAYVAGANVIAAANAQLAASGTPVVATQTATTRALVDSGLAFDRYRRQVDANYQVAQQFVRAQDAATKAVDSHRVSADAANAVLDAYRERLGLLTAAQQAFAAGQDRVVAAIVAQRAAAQQLADIQSTVNNFAGVTAPTSTDDYESRAADIAAYGDELDRLRAKFNPLFAVSKQYETGLNEIAEAERLGAISANEAAAAQERLTAQFAAANTPLGQIAGSSKAAEFAVRDFGVQSIDVFSQLASGAPIMTTFIQQGSQIVQVMAVSGTSVSQMAAGLRGALASAFSYLLTPMGLAVAGAVAVTGAVTAVAVAAENSATRIGTLQNQLSLVRTDFAATAEAADKAARDLAGQSFLGLSDARAGVNAIYGQGDIFTGSTQQAEQLALVNARLSQQLGETAINAQRAGQIVADPGGVLAQLLKDHPGIDAFNQQTVDTVRHLQEMGQQGDALNVAFAALLKLTANEKDAVTPLQQAWLDLEKALYGARDGGQSVAQALGGPVLTALTATVNGVTKLVDGLKWISDHAPSIAPSVNSYLLFGPTFGPLFAGISTLSAAGGGASAGSANSSGLARGLRNNNPLNLSYLPGQGAIGSDGRFGIYPDMATGIAANEAQLTRYQDVYGLNTIGGIVNKWAPSGENDPSAYAAIVAKAMGMGAGDQLDLHNADTMKALVSAMSKVENGPNSPDPFSLMGAGGANPMAGAVGAQTDSQAAAAAAPLASSTAETSRLKALEDIQKAEAALQLPNLDDSHIKEYGQALDDAQKRLYEAVTASDALERSVTLQTSGEQRIAAAWGAGAVAAAAMTERVKAEGEARNLYAPGTAQYASLVDKLTDAYHREAAAAQEVQLAQASSQTRDQIAVLDLETQTLGKDSAARVAQIAHLQNEQTVRQQFPDLLERERQARVADLDQINQMTDSLQRQQAGLDALGQGFSQAFDTIGNAATQSFLQGQGAAVNWANVMTSVVQQVIQQFLKLALLNPILNSLGLGGASGLPTLSTVGSALQSQANNGTGLGGILSNLGILTASTTGNAASAAVGAGFDFTSFGDSLIRTAEAHSGWNVGAEPAPATRYVHPTYFDNAPRFHSGLAPDEMAAVLQKGEAVLTGRQQRAVAAASSGGDVTHLQMVFPNVRSSADADTFRRSSSQMLRAAYDAQARAKTKGR